MIARLLLFAFRILAALYLVRLLLGWLRGLARPAAGRDEAPANRGQVAADLVRDRVCNTFLPRERAVRAVIDGHEEYFCSTACRDRALASTTSAS